MTNTQTNSEQSATYNLTAEHWIPIVYVDGHTGMASLRSVFQEAPKIRELSGDIPQQKIPMIRLLLAIMYRVFCEQAKDKNNDEKLNLWLDFWNSGQFNQDMIDQYFNSYHNCFYLVGGNKPFMQVPDLQYASEKEYSEISEVLADVPKPGKFLFSQRSQQSLGEISLDEAARWLIFFQAYDTAGIKTPVVGNTHIKQGKVFAPKDSVGTGWLGAIGGVINEGRTLFETLMLNWCLFDGKTESTLLGNQEDTVPWERDTPLPDIEYRSNPMGPADLFTWQDRRICLVPNESMSGIIGIVSCYGDILTAVDKQAFETMTVWRLSAAQQKKLNTAHIPVMPRTLDPSKALWRGLGPLLATSGEDDLRPGVVRWLDVVNKALDEDEEPLIQAVICSQGIAYGTQSSTYEDAIDDSIDFHAELVREDSPAVKAVINVIDKTDKAVFEVVKLVQRVERCAGDKRQAKTSTILADDIREHSYIELDDLFRRRIADFTKDTDVLSYERSWFDDVHILLLKIGRQYIHDSAASVFMLREANNQAVSVATAEMAFLAGLNTHLGHLSHSNQNDNSQDAV